jgi:hypothetical protein
MLEGELPERAGDELTNEDTLKPTEQTPARGTEQDFFGRINQPPPGEDPAYWPVHVLNRYIDYIVDREHLSNAPDMWNVPPRETGERFAPMLENISTVKTAYEILAYPHCKLDERRERIEVELEADRQRYGRDHVELSDAELAILGKIAAE